MARRGARPALRLFATLAGMSAALALVAAQLVRLQVVNAQTFENLGSRQRVRSIALPAERGTIFDRNMVPLAVSVPARAVFANPQDIVDPEATARKLSEVLGLEVALLRDRLKEDAPFVYLARKVEVPVADRVAELNLAGIGMQPESKRVYPQGSLAAQVVGFVGTDGEGLAGIEAGQGALLAGTPGRQVTEVDPAGRPIPQGRRHIVEPLPGKDVVLTIDRNIQFAAEDALDRALAETGAQRGSAVVIEPQSGEILAMANRPALDPQLFASASAVAIRNRTVEDSYEPGSVNKLVTAAAALEAGVTNPSEILIVPDTIRIGGKIFSDYAPHPTSRWTYADVLARSSNVGTIMVAQRVGRQRMYDMLRKFGLGAPTGVGFPGEATGILQPVERWYETDMATIPVGQGIAVTPLQMATVYGAIANDGTWTQPTLVRRILDRGKARPAQRPAQRPVIRPYTAAQLRAMLLGVVESGTGRSARIPGYLVGGKTGTARIPLSGGRGYSKDVVTTFMGMVPVDRPRLVAAVVMDNPATHFAAVTAAPAWKQIVEFALGYLRIPPSFEATTADSNRGGTP